MSSHPKTLMPFVYLNTTNVSVQLSSHPKTLMPFVYLNTTNVSVQLSNISLETVDIEKFKYNKCIGSIKPVLLLKC